MNLYPKIPKTAVMYRCSRCGTLRVFLDTEEKSVCDHCLARGHRPEWLRKQTVHLFTPNPAHEIEKNKKLIEIISDAITAFSGNIYFVIVHIVWFFIWIYLNLKSNNPLDPYPFGLLTMIVSLEAIFLATFVMISQNREAQKTKIRDQIEFEANIKAEKKVTEILEILKSIKERKKQN